MDPYIYPGANVLRNLRDIRDPEPLSKAEGIATARRMVELQSESKPGKFDTQHLQEIHQYIFQDIYPWTGELRTVNIARSGQFPFAFPEQIAPSLHNLSRDAKEGHLRNISLPKFSNRAAHNMGELNAIHPFWEGDRRTQREFIRQLTAGNGYFLDWFRVSREQMNEGSNASFQRGDNARLENILQAAHRTGRGINGQPLRDSARWTVLNSYSYRSATSGSTLEAR